MKMIVIEEGSEEMLPWVRAEVEPSLRPRNPFERWWYEVSYYDPSHKIDGMKVPVWVHDYSKDGGGLTLRGAMLKAREAVLQICEELPRR